MNWTRPLKRYRAGDDVVCVKQKLVSLGYLASATKSIYGNDTYRAVKKFQEDNGLEVDGTVGPITWKALFGDEEPEPTPTPEPEPTPTPEPSEPVDVSDIPEWYGADVRTAIATALSSVSENRKKVCLIALQWAIDPLNPTETLKGFYIRAGKTYGTDLSANIMTLEKLTKYFNKSGYKQYFDNGRKEMMLEQSEKDGYNKIGGDCSGAVCGWLRKAGVVSASFAACANSLYNSKSNKRSGDPVPGDFAWKSGHIGLYVGGGYVVEAAGGAYGIQLTKNGNRRVYNYVKKKLEKMSNWTAFGNPKCFKD